jgi:hypothetical protein
MQFIAQRYITELSQRVVTNFRCVTDMDVLHFYSDGGSIAVLSVCFRNLSYFLSLPFQRVYLSVLIRALLEGKEQPSPRPTNTFLTTGPSDYYSELFRNKAETMSK